MRRVVVTGLGAITPLGVGVRRSWSRLLAGESGITSIADREPRERWRELTSTVAGVVPTGAADGSWRPSDWLSATDQRRMSTFTQYAAAASSMALKDAGWEPENQDEREATGVCIGSGIGNLDEMYETSLAHSKGGYKKVSPMFVPKILLNMAAGHIAMLHGFQGPNHAATTACTTGAHSIGDASRFIALGDADVMVAGGSESCIHPLTFAGFGRARSLCTAYNDNPASSCRPFDSERGGFVVAEGAAVCILEELEHAKARGAHIYAEIKGYGCSGDAYHMTAPLEDGQGAYLAMKRALKAAGIKPSQVDYINAHATATRVGDAAEAAAIQRIMLSDDGVSSASQVTVSSTKGSIGHLLGAAGAIEAIFTILAIHEGVVPATMNLQRPDVGPDFNFVPLTPQEKKVDVAVTNSFGFGGTNSSLVFSKLQSHTRTLVRAALRAGAMRAPSRAATPFAPLFQHSRGVTVRNFSETSRRSFLGGMGGITNSYRVVGATDRLFKLCADPADYYITPEARKKDQVERLEDGEEVGNAVHEGNVWHHAFNFRPTFSTWSHVTMLHLYLLNTRIRCFERDEYRTWQQQLIDHFFFECEKKMHVEHSISSSALRQRYLKDIFVQWRGLVLAYDEGLVRGDAILASAVWRNLFKGVPDVDPRALVAVVGWIRSCTAMLEATSDASFTSEADKIFANQVESFWPKFESAPQVKEAAQAKPIAGGAQAGAAKPVQAGKAAKV
ncbi:putative 3-oxoacyl-[acyl-carrier-protein] synthase [Paramyrothecium foliicola]|nr:putative 3-oxoacyl-[acyl-carrier-protein] synthase [Paramyrothecium foliicola]